MNSRIDHAMRLREEGYNCAQAVLIPFSEELGFPADRLAVISSALGSGAGQGELCGVANALALAEGMLRNNPHPEGKKAAMCGARDLGKAFSEPYGGCITCRDLKGKCGKTCHELVAEGVRILEERIKTIE